MFSERINSYEKLLTAIILTRFTECQICRALLPGIVGFTPQDFVSIDFYLK